ncbi:hypothetical protein STENM327S_00265 [Streptomyces tendae]
MPGAVAVPEGGSLAPAFDDHFPDPGRQQRVDGGLLPLRLLGEGTGDHGEFVVGGDQDGDVVQQGQQCLARVLGRPQALPVVDVQDDGPAAVVRVGGGLAHRLQRAGAECAGDAGQVQDAGAGVQGGHEVDRGEQGGGGVAAPVVDADQVGHASLTEHAAGGRLGADAGVGGVDAFAAQCAQDQPAGFVVADQAGPGGPVAQAGQADGHVGLGTGDGGAGLGADRERSGQFARRAWSRRT